MKKVLSTLLALALLLGLCACGQEDAEEAPAEAVWHGTMTSSFPMGMDGEIKGVTAAEGGVFVGGEQNGKPKILRLAYTIDGSGIRFGEQKELELPHCEGETELAALTRGGESIYALLCGRLKEEKTVNYTMGVYNAEGSLETSFPLPVRDNAALKSMLVTDEGVICLRETHHISLFSPSGEPVCVITDLERDFAPPLLIDGEIIAQVWDGQTIESALYRVDAEKAALIPIELKDTVLLSSSRCQSLDGLALINDGGELLSVDKSFRVTRLFDWYELTGNYGNDYRYICRLSDSALLMVPKDSGELISMNLYSTVPTRSIRVAFCGWAESQTRVLENMFRHYATDYNVECVRFSNEEADVARLKLELGTKSDIDLVICDWYLMEPYSSFVDLYPLLDADEELKREDFPDWLLKGLERDGRLNQLWGSFGISTWRAKGPLLYEPSPLKLKDCQAVLDKQGVTTLLFDSYETKDRFLSSLTYPILTSAYDEESGAYQLDTPYVRELLEFCNSLPAEDPYKIMDGDANAVDPALWHSESTLYVFYGVNGLINDKDSKGPSLCRYFDGSDGGDNLSALSCNNMSCYMIPESCPDVENAWGFLRTLLTADFQTAFYNAWGSGLPINTQAFETVITSVASEETQDKLHYMIAHSPICSHEYRALSDILVSSMLPWFNGDATLDDALEAAQGRINIYVAERAD